MRLTGRACCPPRAPCFAAWLPGSCDAQCTQSQWQEIRWSRFGAVFSRVPSGHTGRPSHPCDSKATSCCQENKPVCLQVPRSHWGFHGRRPIEFAFSWPSRDLGETSRSWRTKRLTCRAGLRDSRPGSRIRRLRSHHRELCCIDRCCCSSGDRPRGAFARLKPCQNPQRPCVLLYIMQNKSPRPIGCQRPNRRLDTLSR